MESQGSNSISSRNSRSAFTISPISVDSSLIRYLQCRSPAAPARVPLMSIENYQTPPSRSPRPSSMESFKTPPSSMSPPVFKVEEDVVVMDGILVGGSVPRGKGGGSSGGKGRSLLLSDSGGSSSESFSWNSPRLKVAHGKEEPRPHRFSNKKKSEENPRLNSAIENKIKANICSPWSCSHGAKCPFIHHHTPESESPTNIRAAPRPKVPKFSPLKLENLSKSYNNNDSFTITSSDWSPLDDGFDISLSREDINSYIDGVLYGPSRGKRLPVFKEICPD